MELKSDLSKVKVEWPSVKEAEKQMRIHHSHISQVANGKRITAGGFRWEYINDFSIEHGKF